MFKNMPNGTDQSYFDDKRKTYVVTVESDIEVVAIDADDALEQVLDELPSAYDWSTHVQ